MIGRVKTYEAIIKGDNIPPAGIPESFKVLLKELQALGLDVRVLGEDGEEVQIMENIDYGDSEYRFDLDDDRKYNDYDANSLREMGYQTKEISADGEFVDAALDENEFSDDYDDSYEDESYDGDDM